MSRHLHRGVLGAVVLVLAGLILFAPAPAHGQAAADDAKAAALNEFKRLAEETQKLRAEGKTAEAIAAAEAMLAIERKFAGGDHPVVAESLGWLAELHVEREDFAAARAARREALEILRKGRGASDWRVVDARQALADVERLAGMDRDRRARLAEAERLNRSVLDLYGAGKYAEAVPPARQALAIHKAALGEHHPYTATSLNNLAELLKSQGDYAAAKPLLEQALAVRKAVLGERHPDTATSLNNLAELLRAQGDYAAKPLLEQALAIRKAVLGERHPDTATSLDNLAGLLKAQGDYAAAKPLLEQALAIRKAALGERHPDTATSLNNLALLLQAQADHAAAKPLLEQALAITKATLNERHPDTATSLNNLALLLESQGDYAAAKPLYEQALAIYKAVLGERHPDTATSLNNLAALLWQQGDYAAAKPLYEQALAIRKAALGEHHPYTATSLNNLAELLEAQGDYAAAKPLLEQALDIHKAALGERHPNTATSLNNLAILLYEQGDYAAAKPLFEQAVDICRGNLDLAADAQTERQQMAMADMLRSSLDAFLSATPRAGIADGVSYRQILAWKGAILERQRRLRDLRRLLRDDPRPEVARAAAEWQSVVVRLATRALAQPGPQAQHDWKTDVARLSEQKDQLEEKLTRQSAAFRAARAEIRRTPEQLQATLPRDAALIDVLEYMHSSPPPERKGRPKFERRLIAFVVRPDRPIARVELGPLAPIRAAIDDWRPILRREKPAPQDEPGGPAARLRRLVWSPLEEHLAGVATVLVSPDGALGLVPLEALPGKAASSYLIEEYTIALVPVPRMFGVDGAVAAEGPKPATAQAEAPSLLLVGDVDYGGDPGVAPTQVASRSAAVGTRAGLLPDFPKLPATGDEIAAIGRYFKHRFQGAQPDELSGELATEAALREAASRHRFLHLATHGYFAPPSIRSALGPSDKPARPGTDLFGAGGVAGFHPGLLSGLALAGANVRPTPLGKDDGILTALEVAELDLAKVELAVLSACETGLGEVAGGEGLLGLQRAFQVAGVRSVVASLWKVPDIATQNLMARFYENLWRKGLLPRAALRAAQLEMLREGYRRGIVPLPADAPKLDRVPPYYWAAFVLSTDRL